MKDDNAYEKRLNGLRKAQHASKNWILKAYYNRAINLTEGSLPVLAKLLACGEEYFDAAKKVDDERFAQQQQYLERSLKELERATQELATRRDDLSLAIAKSTSIQASLALDVSKMFETNTMLFNIRSDVSLKVVPALAEQLFDSILSPNENSFKLKAAMDGINFVIGLVPIVGDLYAGFCTVYGISTARGKGRKLADRHLVYLEEYCKALEIWGAAAHSAIRTLQVSQED